MKTFIHALLASVVVVLFPILKSFSQVVTVPEFPTDSDSVTILFDATQGNGELANVPPPIYAHTGVITNLSTGGTDWKYVIAGWTENLPKCQMTPLGNNLYQLKIGPSVRQWYGVPASEQILKMAFVFRNSDGSKVGRTASGGDIFADVYPAGMSVNITKPSNKNLFVYLGDTISVSAAGPLADSMFLYVEGTLKKSVAGNLITDTLVAAGQNWIKTWVTILAKNDTAAAADSFSYAVMPTPTEAELPAGTRDGINYIDSNTVILCLLAPYKKNVFVIGDFNDWQPGQEYYMNITPDKKRYWLQLNNLVPRQEYIFQYLVDGTLRIGDPYADKVSDPNDRYITSATYPGLKPYPEAKTTGIATYLQTAQLPYAWSPLSFTPPAVTDLVVYELLLRDFLAAHSFAALTDTLSYLKRLGINAIELMPVMEFEGNSSWGYNPDYMFAVDKYYGPKDELKRLVDTAHSQGIAVILDIVCNHQFGQSPLVRLYWDATNQRPAANSPWFNQIPKHPANVGFDFNHESYHTRIYMERLIKYWIQEYHVDGYRFDLSKGFTQINSYPDNWALWAHYDGARINTLSNYAYAIRSVKPDAYVILEHFADNSEETVLSANGDLLWANMCTPFEEASMGYNTGSKSDYSWASYKQRGWDQPHAMVYMESHDEERMMFKNITYGNSAPWGYNIKDTLVAEDRIALCANQFFVIPGPKMFWEFGELGYDYSINYPCMTSDCRLDPKPPRWDYYQDFQRRRLYNIFSTLIGLKKELPVFETADYTMDVQGALKKIILRSPSMNLVSVGNFDIEQHDMIMQFPTSGKYYEFWSGDSITASGGYDTINLARGAYRLYTSVRLERPVFLSAGDPYNPGSDTGSILTYPNPCSSEFTFVTKSMVRAWELYSVMGLKVAGAQVKGNGPGTVDVSQLPAGTYIFRAVFDDGSTAYAKIIRQ